MPTDLEIARSVELAPIEEIAWTRGIGVEEPCSIWTPHGKSDLAGYPIKN